MTDGEILFFLLGALTACLANIAINLYNDYKNNDL